MRKPAFYLRLALRGLVRNRQYCGPFFLTAAFCSAMCYIMRYLSYSPFVQTMHGADYVAMMLTLGSAVMAFLIVWIMVYANGFVQRRRGRELALYNILGMEKRHLAVLLALESALIWAGSSAVGLAGGALLSKLALAALLRLMHLSLPLGFAFCLPGALETAVAMALLFGFLYLRNLWQVGRMSPIELLHSDRTGEREPRSRRLAALAGAAALAGGYALSILTRDPVMALLLFFAAVALVIVGTHLLFGAGSVVLLKALRANRRFYYRPRAFVAVSGLIYRMNQNARGLANICILSTTVLVSVATTVCLYTGMEASLQTNYPHDLLITSHYTCDTGDDTALRGQLADAAAPWLTDRAVWQSRTSLELTVTVRDGVYRPISEYTADAVMLSVLTVEDYNAAAGLSLTLDDDEVLVAGADPAQLRYGSLCFAASPAPAVPEDLVNRVSGSLAVVVSSRQVLETFRQETERCIGEMPNLQWQLAVDDPGASDEALLSCAEAMQQTLDASSGTPFDGAGLYLFCQPQLRQEFTGLYGSFVFLGLFLALLFTMATVLMIYYKQLSEGYEDRGRFVILQKVGMSAEEVRAAIRTQVLLVFFLPLAAAAVHLAAAFPMLSRMVEMFGITDLVLFAEVALAVLAVFAVCYTAVYAMTARQYYRIVRR